MMQHPLLELNEFSVNTTAPVYSISNTFFNRG